MSDAKPLLVVAAHRPQAGGGHGGGAGGGVGIDSLLRGGGFSFSVGRRSFLFGGAFGFGGVEKHSIRYRATSASSGTHTHTLVHEYRRLALALTGAPVCGSRKLPEGGRRDTAGNTGGGLRDSIRSPTSIGGKAGPSAAGL